MWNFSTRFQNEIHLSQRICVFHSASLSCKRYKMNFTRKNIILDLDATLIDTQSLVGARSALVLGKGVPTHTCGSDLGHLCIFKRPGVDAFIEWCFKNFENVGTCVFSFERRL